MARICPMEACREPFAHGHGGDETFLPNPHQPSSGPVQMEVCPHASCEVGVEHCHPDPESETGLTPYYLSRPKPVCPYRDCTVMIDHGHGSNESSVNLGSTEFTPHQRCAVLPGCRMPRAHQHGATGSRSGTMLEPSEPGFRVSAINGRQASGRQQSYTKTDGSKPGWQDQFGAVWSWDDLIEPVPWVDPRKRMPDFDEDPTSVRGPGWGTRTCQHCDHETFGGTESSTKEAMWEHLDGDDPDRRCPVLHPKPVEVPTPGGFDAALYAAYVAGATAEYGFAGVEEFYEWRREWHGEWETL